MVQVAPTARLVPHVLVWVIKLPLGIEGVTLYAGPDELD